MNQKQKFIISCLKTYWLQYAMEGNRLWIVANKITAKKEMGNAILKGYFDASFLNFNRFPTDDSMYLFLWDPKSPDEKRSDMPIE